MNVTKEELINKLSEADKAYYDLDDPIITDQEYDQLVKDYLDLTGQKWMQFGSSGSVQHKRPMLSLNKAYTMEEAIDFLGSTHRVYVMPKIDGGSLSLWYERGKLVKALTRGKLISGTSYGEDVTAQVKQIASIPKKLGVYSRPHTEIRGEIYLPINKLAEANKQRLKDGETEFKNCRNAATGILRNESGSNYYKYLSFVAYEMFDQDVPQHHDLWFDTFSSKLSALSDNGFRTPSTWVKHEISELTHDQLKSIRDGLSVDYETDGLVLVIEDMNTQRSLGLASRYPKYSVAYKFESEVATTTIREITWTATRTGMVKPKAIFDPVELDGTTVTQATLHNAKHVIDLGIDVGDVVEVFKAGQIIPQVSRVVTKVSKLNASQVDDCPSCGTLLWFNATQTDIVCGNPSCKPKLVDLLVYSAGKKNWDIDLGESLAEALVDAGMVSNLSDLFGLSSRVLELSQLKLGGKVSLGNSRAKKLVAELEAAKSKPWHITLHALGCPGLGEPECREIAKRYSLQDLLAFYDDSEEFIKAMTSIKGMGKTTAQSLEKFLWDNHTWLGRLSELGLDINKEQVVESTGNLVGLTFCITGTHSCPRSVLEQLITDNGGTVTSSVSKKLSYLVAGQDAGSKLEKANKANVKVIDEDGLRCLIKETL